MGITFQLNSVRCTFYHVHVIKYLLKIVQHLWMVFHKFGESIAIALACAFFSPYQVYVTYFLRWSMQTKWYGKSRNGVSRR